METIGNNLTQGHTANLAQPSAEDKAYLTCPHCAKPYQIVSPQEGLVYQCQKCQNHFMVKKEAGRFQSYLWSEDQILKILFELAGEHPQSKLARAWRNVFENLEDSSVHEQFITLCRQKNSINLAKEKYKQLGLYLNWDALPENLRNILDPDRVKPSPWSERMPWILLSLSVVLILLGSVLPGHRNMIGAGVLVAIIDFMIYRKRFMKMVN